MKKLMIAAAALAAGVAMADVESANVVGYNTLEINKEYTLLAVNFEGITETGTMDIQDLFKKCDGMTTANAASAADQIQIMHEEDGNYDYYYLSNGKAGKASTPATTDKWVCNNEGADKTVPAVRAIKSGEAFWYVSPKGKEAPYTITVAGSVMAAPNVTKEFGAQYALIGNPYPCDIPLNDGVQVINATYANAASAADQIQIMKADGNYDYYYLSNGKAGKASTPATANKWVCNNEGADKTVPTDGVFPASRAGWFVRINPEAKVKFVSPIAK